MSADLSGLGIVPGVSVTDTVGDELGPLAEQAVQAVRTLIHQSRPAVGVLGEPAQAADLLAILAELTGMLPQLLDHLQCWLLDQHRHRRLRTDHEGHDAGLAVQAVTVALAHAGASLSQTGHALQAAHQDAARLAVLAVPGLVKDDHVDDDVDEVTQTTTGRGQR